jgi:hypothetical protein
MLAWVMNLGFAAGAAEAAPAVAVSTGGSYAKYHARSRHAWILAVILERLIRGG